ncbi:hypothetical protein Dimus_029513, partial [Dionaea muscipula]
MATVGDGEVEQRIALGRLLLGGGRYWWQLLAVVLLAWRWTSRAAEKWCWLKAVSAVGSRRRGRLGGDGDE